MTLGKSLNPFMLQFLLAFKTELISPIRVMMIVFVHVNPFHFGDGA